MLLKRLRLFVTDCVLEGFVEPTRLVAIQKGDESFDVSKEEIIAFIGIKCCYGNYSSAKVRDYWSTSTIFSLLWFLAITSRDRFFKISSYLHLVDAIKQEKKRGESGCAPLYKVRPLINKPPETFAKYYQPKWVCPSIQGVPPNQ